MTNSKPTFGIPYAFGFRNADGSVDPSSVVCPVCNARIQLTGRKPGGGGVLSKKAYAKHYSEAHAGK